MTRIRLDSTMTFRVQRSAVDDAVVLVLSGDIAGDHTADLETLVDTGKNGPVVLDLKDVSLVDRAGVLLLARSEGRGATLLNCPSYVREWIHREREFAHSEQRAGGMSSGEHSMTSGVASGAREETLENQGGKETVMADITAWIEARLPGGAKSGADH